MFPTGKFLARTFEQSLEGGRYESDHTSSDSDPGLSPTCFPRPKGPTQSDSDHGPSPDREQQRVDVRSGSEQRFGNQCQGPSAQAVGLNQILTTCHHHYDDGYDDYDCCLTYCDGDYDYFDSYDDNHNCDYCYIMVLNYLSPPL
eukprot:gene9146-biopygen3969